MDMLRAKMQLKLVPGALKPMLKVWKLRAQLLLEQAKLDALEAQPGAASAGVGAVARSASAAAAAAAPAARALLTPPLAPRQMSATGRSITMTWKTELLHVTRYEVQVRELDANGRTDKNKQWRTITRNCRDTTITIHDLRSGALFAVRVRARVSDRWSDYSAVSRPARTVKLCPERPSKPRCDQVTTNSMKVSWDEPEDNGSRITIYTLLCGKLSDHGDMVVLYSGPSSVCDAVNLQPCTAYSFRIIATNAFGDSDVSEPCVASTQTPRTDAPLRTIGCWSEWWDSASGCVYFVNEVYVIVQCRSTTCAVPLRSMDSDAVANPGLGECTCLWLFVCVWRGWYVACLVVVTVLPQNARANVGAACVPEHSASPVRRMVRVLGRDLTALLLLQPPHRRSLLGSTGQPSRGCRRTSSRCRERRLQQQQ